MDFFSGLVAPELRDQAVGQRPVLRASCLKFVTVFRNQLPREQARGEVVSGLSKQVPLSTLFGRIARGSALHVVPSAPLRDVVTTRRRLRRCPRRAPCAPGTAVYGPQGPEVMTWTLGRGDRDEVPQTRDPRRHSPKTRKGSRTSPGRGDRDEVLRPRTLPNAQAPPASRSAILARGALSRSLKGAAGWRL